MWKAVRRPWEEPTGQGKVQREVDFGYGRLWCFLDSQVHLVPSVPVTFFNLEESPFFIFREFVFEELKSCLLESLTFWICLLPNCSQ